MTRTEEVRVRMTPEEKVLVQVFAKTQHLAFSSWARKVLLDALTEVPGPWENSNIG